MNMNQLLTEIDLDALEKKLSGLVEAPVKLVMSVVQGRTCERIRVVSQDLIDYAGIFKAAMKDVHITSFNSEFSEGTKDKGPYLWMTIQLSYEHLGGGSNGAQITTAWWRVNEKKWEFRDEGK